MGSLVSVVVVTWSLPSVTWTVGNNVYDAVMDWLPLTSTLLGALIGVGSALVVDRAKWRRDQEQQAREKRRAVYVEFLCALHTARESVWLLSIGIIPPGKSLEDAAREILPKSEVWIAGERLLITAPQTVIDVADMVTKELRHLRDVVGAGYTDESPEYRQAESTYVHAVVNLRATIRNDLDVRPST
jgi:hypothetical protein